MLSPVAEIKERLSIVDVISGYVKLEKAGIHYKARCPFHNEKTPSFFVSADRGSYHCFGCGKGGDIFSFVGDIEGLDFPETLKMLAERAGVMLERKGSNQDNKEETEIFYALEEATKFYEARLRENKEVIEYLKSRGLTGETAKKFRIGFAPDGWRNLTHHLEAKKIPHRILERAGLVIKSDKGNTEGNYYDRFRSRIMFPINSSNGKVVAFSGRIFGEEDGVGKYVNSPETDLYHKSKILFGYDKAKHSILQTGRCVIVEGQMDLCMAHQAGTTEAVAVSGTALTLEHLKLIKRFTDKVIFSFDSDKAGVSAAKRSVMTALEEGMDVYSVALVGAKDPAEIIKENKEEWLEAVKSAKPFIEFYLNYLEKNLEDKRSLNKEVTKEILPLIAMLKSRIDQEHFVGLVAEKLGVTEHAVRDDLKKVKIKDQVEEKEIALNNKESIDRIKKHIIGGYLWKADDDLEKAYEEISGTTLQSEIEKIPEPERQSLILLAELTYKEEKNWKKDAKELIISFEKELLDKKFEKLLGELKIAEKESDSKRGMEILKECQDVRKRIEELKMSRIKNN